MVKICYNNWAFDRNKTVNAGKIGWKTKNKSLSKVHWCIIINTNFALSQTLYKTCIPLPSKTHSYPSISSHRDNISKSSKNSKESSSKEIGKAIKDAERKKPKNDKLNKAEGSESLAESYVGASLVGKTSVSKVKKIKISQDLA